MSTSSQQKEFLFPVPFDPSQVLNVQVTIRSVYAFNAPVSYSVSNINHRGFTINVGLASATPATGSSSSPSNEIAVDYLVQATKNATLEMLPRPGFYDITFTKKVCEQFKLPKKVVTGVWVLFTDCAELKSAQRMHLTTHVEPSSGNPGGCKLWEYSVSIPNGHTVLQVSFSNYPWCEFSFFVVIFLFGYFVGIAVLTF